MFHTLAYSSAVASTSLTQVNALANDIYPINSNDYVLNQNLKLPCAMVVGGIVAQAQISQPSLNKVLTPNLEPIVVGSEPPTNANLVVYPNVPLPLAGQENIEILAANSSTTSTQVTTLLWVQDSPVPIPQGPQFTLRGTASGTASSYVWTNVGNITWAQSLAQGTYAICGFRCISATCIGARLVILGQQNKPGVSGNTAEGQRQPAFFEDQELGVFGQFPSYVLPGVEALCVSGDSSFTIYLNLVKIA